MADRWKHPQAGPVPRTARYGRAPLAARRLRSSHTDLEVTVSAVVPVLNDAEALARLLADLRGIPDFEVVVVDGGSQDGSVEVAESADVLVTSSPGRGHQIRAGVDHASGEWLWFLHADSRVSRAVIAALRGRMASPGWGFCRVRLDGPGWPLRVVETAMNWRSGITAIATGDQGIFAHSRLLEAIGGVPSLPLMEDIECCRRLRRLAPPRRLEQALVTSARRWQHDGTTRTVLLMWWLRLRYWAGADAAELARRYYANVR